jgi:2-oxoglutarate ferredoxin oxidoreductase subunit beta
MPERAPITAEYPPGGVRDVLLHDGGTVRLRKLHADYDPSDKVGAMAYLQSRRAQGEVVTGLLYIDTESDDMHASLRTVDAPLNTLGDAELVPGNAALASVNAALR